MEIWRTKSKLRFALLFLSVSFFFFFFFSFPNFLAFAFPLDPHLYVHRFQAQK